MGWVSILDPARLNRDLDVPEHWRFIGYFCIGYPSEQRATPELVDAHWEKRADPASLILHR
jgi:5,6-dimethylbenzimidazole synthase